MTSEQRTRTLDVVVYGATGFVGRLVAEYLARSAPGAGNSCPTDAAGAPVAGFRAASRQGAGSAARSPSAGSVGAGGRAIASP